MDHSPLLPLAHVSWALADNALRPACDAFFIDVFGAETAYEMLVTPEAEAMGLDREERLMVVGDTMLIPIAAAGRGAAPDSPIGGMLRRSAAPDRWLGVSLRAANLKDAAAWYAARGFQLHFDPGMEDHYFLISRKQALGVRIEVMQGELPNDPRLKPGWRPQRWRDEHPLGIEGLQSIGVSTASLDEARAVFGKRLGWPEIAAFARADADCAAFLLGDTVIEALAARDDGSPLARHAREVQGICCLTFKVRSARAAADYLRGKGLALTGDPASRFAITGEQAQGRTIWFTEIEKEGYPAPGSLLCQPAVFAGTG
ncbi:MAG: VOC family protein [Sphingomonadales bacterium]|nr:VOC family protein [Sphingomonadales bacterium]